MTAAVCTLGPAAITRLPAHTEAVESTLVCAAMDGGDGRFVLVGDEPVPLRQVWIDSLRPALGGADTALLIHPSWWTAPRIELVRAAAAEVVSDVELVSRSTVLTHRHPTAAVVEIASQVLMVVVDGVPVAVYERSGPPEALAQLVTDTLGASGRDRAVVIDAPAQIVGAEVLARSISTALAGVGIGSCTTGDRQLGWAATALVPAEVSPQRAAAVGARWPVMVAVALIAAVLAAGVVAAGVRRESPAVTALTALIEGGVVMQVPADWRVHRVTDGPGSARVQVISPMDPDAVLHLTQTRMVHPDLADTATVLRRAVDAEPPGTFVDFNPTAVRAGRSAVTYREIRPGRDILWTVLVDGDVRISIGCQNAVGRSIAVAAACDDAIRTAQRAR